MGDDTEDTAESPLDLGLKDLLVLHDTLVSGMGEQISPVELVSSSTQSDSPKPAEPSLYASLASTGDWSALVRRCEDDGLKTPLSRVWWMRAHLEGGSMPTSLLVSAWERAEREEELGTGGESAAEANERRQVLAVCRRWFGNETARPTPPNPEQTTSLAAPGPVESSPEAANNSKGTAAPAPVETVVSQSPPGVKVPHRSGAPALWVRRAIVVGALLLFSGGAIYAIIPADETADLKAPPMLESPLPQVPLEVRSGELVPFTGLEVLHVAMEELVKPKEPQVDLAEVIEQKPVSPSTAPSASASPAATPSPKEALALDGPIEPISVRDRRLRPERDPGPAANGRGQSSAMPSVWDQIGGMVTPAPQRGGRASDPQDFFDSVDDHPGYPVERFKEPRPCQLAVGGAVRTRPSDFAPTTSQLEQGDSVMVEEQMGPWLKLRGRSGRPGYVKSMCRGEADGARREDDDEGEWKR